MNTGTVLYGTVPEAFKGSGDGYGYGYGYGYGDGYGYGYGYGDGDGYGYGYGYGYGDGYGYGSGYGYGDGYGSGYGYGSKEYWASVLPAFIRQWPADQQKRAAEMQSSGATIAYWRSDASGRPCNGGSGGFVSPGDVQKISGPLRLCEAGALHATTIPPKWKGERVWIVAMVGEIAWQDDKCGTLERVILGECL